MYKIGTLVRELIDLYSPEELELKGIKYIIEEETSKRFTVHLNYKDQYYVIKILPLFNPKQPSINFGSTDENYENLNLNKLLNSVYSSRILAAIFGLIRYWVDKYNVKEFQYGAEGRVRNQLYNYYLTKHFPDFENTQEVIRGNIIQIWTRI